MLDTNEFTKSVRGEIRSGVVRRRRWSDAEKGRIVAEAVAPGAVIAVVARRHELTPQHLSNWIRAAKDGRLCLPDHGEIAFVPVVAGGLTGSRKAAASDKPVEVVIGSVVVRVPSGADGFTVETVLSALLRR
jgi:transposase